MTPGSWTWLVLSSGALLMVCGLVLGLWASGCIGRRAERRRPIHLCAGVMGIGLFVAGERFLVSEWAPLSQVVARIPRPFVSLGFGACVLVVLAGLVLAAWGLFGDRAHGRRRCPRCWYDMSATAGLVCPECGHDAQWERRLRRARPLWRRVAVGMVLAAVGGAAGVVAAVPIRTLWAWMPDAAVIAAVPYMGSDLRAAPAEEFWRRGFVSSNDIVVFGVNRPLAGLELRQYGFKPLSGFERWLMVHGCLRALESRSSPAYSDRLLVLAAHYAPRDARTVRLLHAILNGPTGAQEFEHAALLLPVIEPSKSAAVATLKARLQSLLAQDPMLKRERHAAQALVRSLGLLGPDAAPAVPELIVLLPLAGPTSWPLHTSEEPIPVVQTLAKIGPGAAPALEHLKDWSELPRMVAYLTISGECPSEEAALARLVSHPEAGTRLGAARELAAFEPFTQVGRDALVEAIDDTDASVVEMAALALLQRGLERERVQEVLARPSPNAWARVPIMLQYGLDATLLVPQLRKDAEETDSKAHRARLLGLIRWIVQQP
jgi:hypothetical protein